MSQNNLKASEVHPDFIFTEFDRLMHLDINDLLQGKEHFEDTYCPACHRRDTPKAFTYQQLDYRRCQGCGLLYISPAPSEEQHLEFVRYSRAMAFWRQSQPEEMKAARKPMYEERAAFTLETFRTFNITAQSVLEVGAGNGEFAEELAARRPNMNIVLLEPQELDLQASGIEIITGGFDALERAERKFDAVIAWELIEHILEPDNLLRLVRGALKPGAPLLLSTPNERSVETRKLKTESSNILFDHVRLYNPVAIQELLARNGFRIISLSTPGQLDVQRIKAYRNVNPEAFADDPALNLILDSPKSCDDYQIFLQTHQLSSHMRVIAIADGEWNGSPTPRM
jgi:SAM-dependent methyltransferase